MKSADVRLRLKRLKELSDGFKAEIVGVNIDRWPFFPVEIELYVEVDPILWTKNRCSFTTPMQVCTTRRLSSGTGRQRSARTAPPFTMCGRGPAFCGSMFVTAW
jgi:hypothetical protein